ncbi:ATP-binding protein [Candidatus Woesearchaeota archaeon]|nr:ATP-binding protein [Candidatus Woesearchaeota archaeon]
MGITDPVRDKLYPYYTALKDCLFQTLPDPYVERLLISNDDGHITIQQKHLLEQNHVLVHGEAGIGTTALLSDLALVPEYRIQGIIPIMIDLATYTGKSLEDVLGVVHTISPLDYNASVDVNLLKAMAVEGKLIFLVDNLHRAKDYDAALRSIDALVNIHSWAGKQSLHPNQVIVACRSELYNGGLEKFNAYSLQRLRKEQVIEILEMKLPPKQYALAAQLLQNAPELLHLVTHPRMLDFYAAGNHVQNTKKVLRHIVTAFLDYASQNDQTLTRRYGCDMRKILSSLALQLDEHGLSEEEFTKKLKKSQLRKLPLDSLLRTGFLTKKGEIWHWIDPAVYHALLPKPVAKIPASVAVPRTTRETVIYDPLMPQIIAALDNLDQKVEGVIDDSSLPNRIAKPPLKSKNVQPPASLPDIPPPASPAPAQTHDEDSPHDYPSPADTSSDGLLTSFFSFLGIGRKTSPLFKAPNQKPSVTYVLTPVDRDIRYIADAFSLMNHRFSFRSLAYPEVRTLSLRWSAFEGSFDLFQFHDEDEKQTKKMIASLDKRYRSVSYEEINRDSFYQFQIHEPSSQKKKYLQDIVDFMGKQAREHLQSGSSVTVVDSFYEAGYCLLDLAQPTLISRDNPYRGYMFTMIPSSLAIFRKRFSGLDVSERFLYLTPSRDAKKWITKHGDLALAKDLPDSFWKSSYPFYVQKHPFFQQFKPRMETIEAFSKLEQDIRRMMLPYGNEEVLHEILPEITALQFTDPPKPSEKKIESLNKIWNDACREVQVNEKELQQAMSGLVSIDRFSIPPLPSVPSWSRISESPSPPTISVPEYFDQMLARFELERKLTDAGLLTPLGDPPPTDPSFKLPDWLK